MCLDCSPFHGPGQELACPTKLLLKPQTIFYPREKEEKGRRKRRRKRRREGRGREEGGRSRPGDLVMPDPIG